MRIADAILSAAAVSTLGRFPAGFVFAAVAGESDGLPIRNCWLFRLGAL
jgi:hypothetical protein